MPATPAMSSRLGAEFLGTFWLVFGGCGTAVLAAGFPDLGVGFLVLKNANELARGHEASFAARVLRAEANRTHRLAALKDEPPSCPEGALYRAPVNV